MKQLKEGPFPLLSIVQISTLPEPWTFVNDDGNVLVLPPIFCPADLGESLSEPL